MYGYNAIGGVFKPEITLKYIIVNQSPMDVVGIKTRHYKTMYSIEPVSMYVNYLLIML